MAVLVVAEHDNATLKDATNKVVTAAKAMGSDVDVLVAGENAGAVAQAAAKIDGVRKVLHADGASLAKQMAEPMDALITPLMANYDAVLFPATTTGKNAAPRIAAHLDVAQLSGVIGVEGADTFVRPIYAGNALVTVKSAQAKNVLTVQPTTFKAAGNSGSRPVRYSFTNAKVGEWTRSVAPSPRARPFTSCVLPAPRSPLKPMTQPGLASRAQVSPRASVSVAL